jgi:hypothetical protein
MAAPIPRLLLDNAGGLTVRGPLVRLLAHTADIAAEGG